MQPRIQDYAIIGDCRAAALISRAGSIDWLCWPRFDSPALFAALLDEGAGRWSLTPAQPFDATRRYLPETNVLETSFVSATGSVRLTDWMPVASEAEKQTLLLPDHEIVRLLECDRGEIEMDMQFEPRPHYGRERARVTDSGKLGVRIDTDGGLLVLRSAVPVQCTPTAVRARVRLRAGDAVPLSLTFADEWLAVLPPLGEWTRAGLARTVAWWRNWAARLTYEGPGSAAVLRSALVLKLLAYAPSGAVVAAPTTSLPERIGGELNWDYRYCWLRDASLTVRALFGLGFAEEAEAFMSWLLHSTRLTRPQLHILYDVHGKAPPEERTLAWLTGYRSSSPVRIGNAASHQLQLDVYGEVIDASTHFVRSGGTFDRETQRMLLGFGKYVCDHWACPDEGIWEPRSGQAHHTYSRVLCWTALDRLIELQAKGHLGHAPVEAFRRAREQIRREVRARSWNVRLRSYVDQLDGNQVDASLLLLAWYGFEAPESERMQRTYACIRKYLGAGDGLLYRYRTGESPGEGAFGICGFWGVEYVALGGGTPEEAQDLFEQLLTYGNDVGLFAEEIDPTTKVGLGNFPQAFTHVGLISTALSLLRRQRGVPPRPHAVHPKSPAPAPESRL